ncbi:hypothetical protein T484DRAFT_1790403 [Baffinella frigidus]|nr:hypothetical protein T484DRAFT_1790403 [Cryptophyta sp. CCMP2293]
MSKMDEITEAPKSDRKKFLWGREQDGGDDAGGYEQAWNNEKVLECSKEIRLGFLRKVYGILTAQLLATAVVCATAMCVYGILTAQLLATAVVCATAMGMSKPAPIAGVYGILSVQLLATAVVCAIAMGVPRSAPVAGYYVLALGSFLAGLSPPTAGATSI